MRRVLSFLLLAVLLASACTSGGGESGSEGPAVGSLGSALDWDRSPGAVIVRLDTAGGTGSPTVDLNTIPFCTLFGDGHVVWLDTFSDPQQVLEAYVGDQAVRAFLEYVIGSGFYSWDQEEGFRFPTPDPGTGPILETITLALYGETHTVDARSSWPPGAFDDLLERCRTLSDSPAIYIPAGAWVSAVPVEPRSDVPSLPWSAFAGFFPEIDLANLPLENPTWMTGDFLEFAWRDVVRDGRTQITDEGVAYRLVIQDPLIQPDAPPPPQATEETP